MGHYDLYKEELMRYTKRMTERGYLIATSGNVSMVVPDEEVFTITPSGKDYLMLEPDDMCVIDYAMGQREGPHKPSIETGLHLAVYQTRPDVGAVIHTHQVWASIFALINEPIPALFDETAMYLGCRVEVIPYAISGSTDLAQNVARALDNQCNAYIMQNHGVIVLGKDIEEAFRNVEVFERMAQAYYFALTSGREVNVLPAPLVGILHQALMTRQKEQAQARQERLRHEGE